MVGHQGVKVLLCCAQPKKHEAVVKLARKRNFILQSSGEPNSSVRFGINLVAELFGSVRPIFSDFYLIVRFGSPNSSAKFWPNSSVSSVRPNFEIGKVRFGSVRCKNFEFGSPLM